MIRFLCRFRDDARGVSLAVTAVMIMSVLSMIALAFDLGLLRTARVEAQRAADSGALAGASAFLDYVPANTAVTPATDRAIEYATSNQIRNVPIVPSEVTVSVDAPSRRVHVLVRRSAIPMWFSRLFGVATAPVAASAMAEASNAGVVDCIVPIALPDWWHDTNNDINNNRIPDPGEVWSFDPGTDQYSQYVNDASGENGLGSVFRNLYGSPSFLRDRGRIMSIRLQGTGANNTSTMEIQPGWFQALDFPGMTGANGWRNVMVAAAQGDCSTGPFSVGDPIPVENGKFAGPNRFAFQDVYDLDPTAYFDPVTETVISPNGINNSPRILKFALFDPALMGTLLGKTELTPNNFAYFFIETRPSNGAPGDVQGRFLYYASGIGGGTANGPLVMQLRLIQ